jgi:hypothetical protein
MSYRIPSVMKRNRGQGSRSSNPMHTQSNPTHTEAGYRPVFADDHSGYQYNMQDNTFDHLPHMQQTVSQLEACSPGHVVRLFDYSILGSHDTETHLSNYSETAAPEGLHDAQPTEGLHDAQPTEGLHDAQPAEGVHDAQPEDELATQVLGTYQIRTISKYIFL